MSESSSLVVAKLAEVNVSSDTEQDLSQRKRRQNTFRSSHKLMISNVRSFFEREKAEGGPILLENVTNRTAAALQVHKSTVWRVEKETRIHGSVHNPEKKGRKLGSGPAQQDTDNFLEGVIRRCIHRFYTSGELPSMDKLLLALKDVDYPFGSHTLYTTVSKMGSRYKTRNKKAALYEQHRIIAARIQYLRQSKQYREQKRPIIYLDETCLNAHHTVERYWIDYDGKGGFRVPSGKGGRLIILHAGWEEGWIPHAKLVLRGKKGTGDYHKEVNTTHFMQWLTEKLLPNLPENSVIVVNNAKYHNSVVEKVSTKSSTKKAMTQYLDDHNIAYDKKINAKDAKGRVVYDDKA